MSVPADGSMNISGDTSMLPDNGSMQKFPSFEGKDLDGNDGDERRAFLRQRRYGCQLLVHHLRSRAWVSWANWKR